MNFIVLRILNIFKIKYTTLLMTRKYQFKRPVRINIHRRYKISKIKIAAYNMLFKDLDITMYDKKYIVPNKDGSHKPFCPCQLCRWNHVYYICGYKSILDHYMEQLRCKVM